MVYVGYQCAQLEMYLYEQQCITYHKYTSCKLVPMLQNKFHTFSFQSLIHLFIHPSACPQSVYSNKIEWQQQNALVSIEYL